MNMMKKILFLFLFCVLGGLPVSAVEERGYNLIESNGNIEIREYSRVVIAAVNVIGERQEAAKIAFRILFKYIDGFNAEDQSFPMTSPVSQAQIEHQSWVVMFYMPAYMTLIEMPTPADPRIVIQEVPEMRVAAIQFSGTGRAKNLNKHENVLRRYLDENQYSYVDLPHYAFYNPPFTPWFLRRNEVMFQIKNSLEIK